MAVIVYGVDGADLILILKSLATAPPATSLKKIPLVALLKLTSVTLAVS